MQVDEHPAICGGSIRPGHPTECDRPATWHVCCTNQECSAHFDVCDIHEIEARALVIEWTAEGGFCPFCSMPYGSLEHATSRWYRLPGNPHLTTQGETA